ncbi:unnamed protein product, partial [Prorocentrum cordatum]
MSMGRSLRHLAQDSFLIVARVEERGQEREVAGEPVDQPRMPPVQPGTGEAPEGQAEVDRLLEQWADGSATRDDEPADEPREGPLPQAGAGRDVEEPEAPLDEVGGSAVDEPVDEPRSFVPPLPPLDEVSGAAVDGSAGEPRSLGPPMPVDADGEADEPEVPASGSSEPPPTTKPPPTQLGAGGEAEEPEVLVDDVDRFVQEWADGSATRDGEPADEPREGPPPQAGAGREVDEVGESAVDEPVGGPGTTRMPPLRPGTDGGVEEGVVPVDEVSLPPPPPPPQVDDADEEEEEEEEEPDVPINEEPPAQKAPLEVHPGAGSEEASADENATNEFFPPQAVEVEAGDWNTTEATADENATAVGDINDKLIKKLTLKTEDAAEEEEEEETGAAKENDTVGEEDVDKAYAVTEKTTEEDEDEDEQEDGEEDEEEEGEKRVAKENATNKAGEVAEDNATEEDATENAAEVEDINDKLIKELTLKTEDATDEEEEEEPGAAKENGTVNDEEDVDEAYAVTENTTELKDDVEEQEDEEEEEEEDEEAERAATENATELAGEGSEENATEQDATENATEVEDINTKLIKKLTLKTEDATEDEEEEETVTENATKLEAAKENATTWLATEFNGTEDEEDVADRAEAVDSSRQGGVDEASPEEARRLEADAEE